MSQNKLQQKVKKRKRNLAIGILIALTSVALVIGLVKILGSKNQRTDSNITLEGPSGGFRNYDAEYRTISAEGTIVRIPLSDFSDDEVQYYKWADDSSGKIIHFFALKSSDGVIRSAFDACDVCYKMARGYSQNGDYMICNNCGQQFASTRINEVKGGCNPSPLNREIEGNFLVIRTNDLRKGGNFFPPFN